ncbi:MAG: DUF192 domain-containing protein [Candidatus Pacebacteria bacterium]|nr:DUF192 domain-containing protein [Candidatus Paceibacterota bacterium]MBP9851408.1 DUF192 domain-containing protein [Candidatus Paceibacterota bacterium]
MKIFNLFIVLAFVGFLIFLALGRRGQVAVTSNSISRVSIAGTEIKVDLALTSEEKAKGLSGREALREDQGMLFIFDYTTRHPFWMKDMLIPIDMIWIDENGVVVYIAENARPESYPSLFGSNVESKYVLEVVSGFAKKYGVVTGSKVEFK